MTPVIRDLGGLEGEVKNAGECSGYLGTQGLKGFGKERIRTGSVFGVEGFEGSLGFRFLDVGVCHAYRCVWGNLGVYPLPVR